MFTPLELAAIESMCGTEMAFLRLMEARGVVSIQHQSIVAILRAKVADERARLAKVEAKPVKPPK